MNTQEIFNGPVMNIGRRGFIKSATSSSLRSWAKLLPVASMFVSTAVSAQSSTTQGILNFALGLEYLENEFYQMALNASNLIPPSDRSIFEQISKHETAHVNFLKQALGNQAITKPTFDFTAGGLYADAFSNYATFLTLSQAFEDTGVRAYKGQAGNLMADNGVLTQALQIHSVEARHAAEVRWLRAEVTGTMVKPWIEMNESNGAPQAVYNGEENFKQNGVDLSAIENLSDISTAAKTRAFDEPLTREQVMAIVAPFIVV
jgi:hypothetical protein